MMALVPTNSKVRPAVDKKGCGDSKALALISTKSQKHSLADGKKKDGSAKCAEQPPVEEVRLFELVRMIREWVERTFTPQQEERLKEKGRLHARFQVALGKEMTAQLQAYVAASFALRLLLIRTATIEKKSGRSQECVEVLLSPEARALYAEKCPDAVAKYKMQMEPYNGPSSGLVDADDGHWDSIEQEQLALEDQPLAIENGQLALENGAPTTANQDAEQLVMHAHSDAQDSRGKHVRSAETVPTARKDHLALAVSQVATPAAPLKRRREDSSTSVKLPKVSKATVVADDKQDQCMDLKYQPPARPKAPSGTGSVWEQCGSQEVQPGIAGLLEAKDVLDKALAQLAHGGVAAIKAEKELTMWLKGLLEREVSTAELRETKIGVTVNACRKHTEPYIEKLSLTILSWWKKLWREAEKGESHRSA